MKKINLTKKQIENIIQEEAIPVGLNITMGIHKQDGKENQDYYKEFGKKMDDYYKPLSDTEKENSDSVMKYSYDKDSDEYHNEYEILNGQGRLRYMNDPDERFKDRAKEAIEGSSNMGNNPEWANVITADQAGFTGPDFGKQLVSRIKSREKKYKEEDLEEKYDGMGDVAIPGAGKGEQRKLAIPENKKTMKRLNEGLTEKGLKYLSKLIKEKGSRDAGMKVIDMILSRELGGLGIYDLPDSVTLMNGLDSIEEAFENGDLQGGFNIAKETAMEMIEDEGGMYMEENQKYNKLNENKKTMKRLRFKKPFNGVENALNLIPESYKVDNKTFQMTDGNENYEIRWEGSINEGKASILKASDKNLMNEDMQRMKELFNFKSQDTLGNLKGSERLNENKQFDAIWDKTKNINEESYSDYLSTNYDANDFSDSYSDYYISDETLGFEGGKLHNKLIAATNKAKSISSEIKTIYTNEFIPVFKKLLPFVKETYPDMTEEISEKIATELANEFFIFQNQGLPIASIEQIKNKIKQDLLGKRSINEMTGGFGFTGEGNMEGMKPIPMGEEEMDPVGKEDGEMHEEKNVPNIQTKASTKIKSPLTREEKQAIEKALEIMKKMK